LSREKGEKYGVGSPMDALLDDPAFVVNKKYTRFRLYQIPIHRGKN
jgi:hypothetical protein